MSILLPRTYERLAPQLVSANLLDLYTLEGVLELLQPLLTLQHPRSSNDLQNNCSLPASSKHLVHQVHHRHALILLPEKTLPWLCSLLIVNFFSSGVNTLLTCSLLLVPLRLREWWMFSANLSPVPPSPSPPSCSSRVPRAPSMPCPFNLPPKHPELRQEPIFAVLSGPCWVRPGGLRTLPFGPTASDCAGCAECRPKPSCDADSGRTPFRIPDPITHPGSTFTRTSPQLAPH